MKIVLFSTSCTEVSSGKTPSGDQMSWKALPDTFEPTAVERVFIEACTNPLLGVSPDRDGASFTQLLGEYLDAQHGQSVPWQTVIWDDDSAPLDYDDCMYEYQVAFASRFVPLGVLATADLILQAPLMEAAPHQPALNANWTALFDHCSSIWKLVLVADDKDDDSASEDSDRPRRLDLWAAQPTLAEDIRALSIANLLK